jgi:thiosulfate/3-mercaptopyruvate sulfurtransferase
VRLARIILPLVIAGVAMAAPARAASAQRAGGESLVVSTAWLAAHLGDPSVVVLDVTGGDSHRDAHVPGARTLPYGDVIVQRDGVRSELPPVDRLRALFERLGVSDSTRVVVYGDEPPMATRVLFTLDYLGHERISLLDGGLAQWRAEGRPVTREEPRVARGRLTPHVRPELVAGAEWIHTRLGRPGIALVDTRTDGEYLGEGERHGMPSAGHLAGARQLQWEQLFHDETYLLRDRDELRRLYSDRVATGDTVVTYCWVGYRASATYLVARYLGYPAKLYDGSYQDWSQRKLAVRGGAAP